MSESSDGQLLSVVIPALNEERGIAAIVERVLAVAPALRAMDVGLELLVVDDGSTDGTAAIVRRYPAARLVCHPRNRGYGAALKTGFGAARGGWLAFLDADGTYPPEEFPALCRAMQGGADMVVGSRRSGAASEMPLVRRVGNSLWSTLVTALSARRVLDPASGMRVFRREALERLYPLPDGLNFTPVMSTRAVHEGLTLVETPIPYRERLGRSKLRVVRDGMRFLNTILWTALSYNPARLLGGVGAALLALAAVAGGAIVVLRMRGVTALDPWGVAALYLGALSAMLGLSLFSLGATFNYLVSLFHKRPVRQGLFGRPIFRTPLDRQFGWMGLLSMAGGLALGLTGFLLGLNGWPIERVWFYLFAGTMGLFLGMQLVLFWVIMRVLEELSRRDALAADDLGCGT